MFWRMTDYGRGEQGLAMAPGWVFKPDACMVAALDCAVREGKRLGLVPGCHSFVGEGEMRKFRQRYSMATRRKAGREVKNPFWFVAPVKSFDDPRFDMLIGQAAQDIDQRATDNKPIDRMGEVLP